MKMNFIAGVILLIILYIVFTQGSATVVQPDNGGATITTIKP